MTATDGGFLGVSDGEGAIEDLYGLRAESVRKINIRPLLAACSISLCAGARCAWQKQKLPDSRRRVVGQIVIKTYDIRITPRSLA
jgi:hypothetical protein